MNREFKNIYFLGIGGIGMSALARYFLHEGYAVAGYDRTATPLTRALEAEGAVVHYDDDPELIPEAMRRAEDTLVVYTPAIPADHREWAWLRERGFQIEKRSQMLGHLAAGKLGMAVAGTHGKTTTSTLAAWLNHAAAKEGSAFLGGISRNFASNLVLGTGRRLVLEADEYDRSFLRLYPDVAVITATDADHLDIYGTPEAMKESFEQFASQIKEGGALILKQGVDLAFDTTHRSLYRYSADQGGDFHAERITLREDGRYRYDIVTPDGRIEDCVLGIPGKVHVENSVAAVAMLWCAAKIEGKELDRRAVAEALLQFEGVKRRMEVYLSTPTQVYIDDYAHHPEELRATIMSLKDIYPGRRLTAIFQPHLYTRTRDFSAEFSEVLSLADKVILLPIYPARELPIEGVCSEMLGAAITTEWELVERDALADHLRDEDTDVVVTFGAGNIDVVCKDVAEVLSNKISK
ncbi:MAG: UDP-N-acetylmuramate--L-alanine ligase [Alistipes sp.]|nr:UDP-N-acetylmuramate--L-alanine ligase [Alistipes sp.]MBQ8367412.1 UDP-N-acetylmuramate--L-alanine ligase [Alistipes sp.]